jgi:GTPase SAR1 family protein
MSTNSKFKILVIGDSKSGKTSLIRTFMNKPFKENLEPTDGLEVSILNFKRVDREY